MTANLGTDQIDDVTDYTVDGSGSTEEYGFIVSSKPASLSDSSTFTSNEQAIPTSSTEFIYTSSAFEYQTGTTSQTSVIDHKAIIDATTPAGLYTQTIRYTITGKF